MTTFLEIALILSIAAIISALMRLFKQPLIIGYILTGLIVGPQVFDVIKSPKTLQVFSEFGITLLLFMVGLNLRPTVIREVGRVASITGLGQVIFTSSIGYLICLALGFGAMASLYIAIALTFSSTIIILKLLSDKGDLQKLYGKISVGFLLVQDIVATIILILISSFSLGSNVQEIAISLLIRGAFIAITLFLIIKFVFPRLTAFFAKSQELLFLFSIAWGMGIAALFSALGFSIEIGALIAGVCLALFPYAYEIDAKMRPLRDFFLVLFFILLGTQMTIDTIGQIALPAILLSAFVLIGNPILLMIVMKFLGFNKRVSFYAGLTVAQISEFSIILVGVGEKNGHITPEITSLVTLIGLITIAISSYMIIYSERIFEVLSPYLKFFDGNGGKSKESEIDGNYDVVLFGYNRIGFDFLESLKKFNDNFIVVDYDPEVIEKLNSMQIPNKYGDAGDADFVDDFNLESLKMVISTVPDYHINAFLIKKICKVNPNAVIIVISHHIRDSYMLYSIGASYVVMPHFLGGKYASALVLKNKFDHRAFESEKEKHLKHLQVRMSMGHDHPENIAG